MRALGHSLGVGLFEGKGTAGMFYILRIPA